MEYEMIKHIPNLVRILSHFHHISFILSTPGWLGVTEYRVFPSIGFSSLSKSFHIFHKHWVKEISISNSFLCDRSFSISISNSFLLFFFCAENKLNIFVDTPIKLINESMLRKGHIIPKGPYHPRMASIAINPDEWNMRTQRIGALWSPVIWNMMEYTPG